MLASLRVDIVEAFSAQKEKCCRAIDVSDYEDLVELPGVGQDEKSDRDAPGSARHGGRLLESNPKKKRMPNRKRESPYRLYRTGGA